MNEEVFLRWSCKSIIFLLVFVFLLLLFLLLLFGLAIAIGSIKLWCVQSSVNFHFFSISILLVFLLLFLWISVLSCHVQGLVCVSVRSIFVLSLALLVLFFLFLGALKLSLLNVIDLGRKKLLGKLQFGVWGQKYLNSFLHNVNVLPRSFTRFVKLQAVFNLLLEEIPKDIWWCFWKLNYSLFTRASIVSISHSLTSKAINSWSDRAFVRQKSGDATFVLRSSSCDEWWVEE